MSWEQALIDAASSILIEVATGKKIKVGGCLPAQAPPPVATRFRPQGGALPSQVDLRPRMPPVEDQSAVNSCASNAIVGIYEYLARRAQGRHEDVSRLFVYYNARRYDGIRGDQGSTMTSNLRVLQDLGACTEDTWPYDERSVNRKPSSEAYDEAAYFKLTAARQIPVRLDAMKACLAEGYPFAFGMILFRSFDRAGKNGVVPMPDKRSEAGRETHGCHAMLAVGYSDHDRHFVVRNSWGTRWGDRGYCYIPYDYLANPRLTADCWTIEAVEDLDFRPDPSRNKGFDVDYDAEWDDSDNPYVFAAVQATTDAALAALSQAVAQDGDDGEGWDDDWSDDWSDDSSSQKKKPQPAPKPKPKPKPKDPEWSDDW